MTGRSVPSSSSTTRASSSVKRKAPGGHKSGSSKKTASSSKESCVPDFEMTEENMAFFKAIQAKVKAKKMAAAASQNEGRLFEIKTSCSDS